MQPRSVDHHVVLLLPLGPDELKLQLAELCFSSLAFIRAPAWHKNATVVVLQLEPLAHRVAVLQVHQLNVDSSHVVVRTKHVVVPDAKLHVGVGVRNINFEDFVPHRVEVARNVGSFEALGVAFNLHIRIAEAVGIHSFQTTGFDDNNLEYLLLFRHPVALQHLHAALALWHEGLERFVPLPAPVENLRVADTTVRTVLKLREAPTARPGFQLVRSALPGGATNQRSNKVLHALALVSREPRGFDEVCKLPKGVLVDLDRLATYLVIDRNEPAYWPLQIGWSFGHCFLVIEQVIVLILPPLSDLAAELPRKHDLVSPDFELLVELRGHWVPDGHRAEVLVLETVCDVVLAESVGRVEPVEPKAIESLQEDEPPLFDLFPVPVTDACHAAVAHVTPGGQLDCASSQKRLPPGCFLLRPH